MAVTGAPPQDERVSEGRGVDHAGVAELLGSLACETRVRIVYLLASAKLDVGQIAAAIDESVPNTSQHLVRLRQAGLVASRREGTRVLNHVTTPRVLDLLATGAELASERGHGARKARRAVREEQP